MKIIFLEKEEDLDTLIGVYKKVILQFSAKWCVPCKSITPDVQEFVETIQNDDIVYVYCNIDNFEELADVHGVSMIPCFRIISNKGGNYSKLISSSDIEEIITFFKDNKIKSKDCNS